METMPNWLMQRAFLTPDRTAIEIEEEKVTFVQLHEKVVSVCEHLSHVRSEAGAKGGCSDEKWYGDDYSYSRPILHWCSSCTSKYTSFKRRATLANE